MTDRERLFDWCVDQMRSGRMTLKQCMEQHASDDPDLAEMLCAVAALQGVAMPDARAAKVRVRARLAAAMSQDTSLETAHPSVSGAGRTSIDPPAKVLPAARSRHTGLAFAALAAAVLLACGLLGLSTSLASANALPGNPLYAVRRAEEWIQLRTAFSDARLGVVLVTLADHRLTEASAEAGAGQVSQARALLREYDNDARQALALSAAMHARGEDARAVLGALAVDLAQAQKLQQGAASQGNGTFAQLLQSSLTSDQQMIRNNHLTLPVVTGGPNGQGHSTASPESHGRQGGSAATPSNGNNPANGQGTPSGNGNGNSNGGGNGNDHGNGTPTPPGTATPPRH